MQLPNLVPGPTDLPGAVSPPVGSPGATPMFGPPPPGGPGLGPGPVMGGGAPGGMPFGGVDDPSSRQYVAKTQSDGTVLLHVKLPNGELGPAVKIISVGGRARPGAA